MSLGESDNYVLSEEHKKVMSQSLSSSTPPVTPRSILKSRLSLNKKTTPSKKVIVIDSPEKTVDEDVIIIPTPPPPPEKVAPHEITAAAVPPAQEEQPKDKPKETLTDAEPKKGTKVKNPGYVKPPPPAISNQGNTLLKRTI